jgi:hypothetical protein
MKFQRTAYGRMGRASVSPAWINRWVKTRRGWQLEVLWRKRGAWVTDFWPAERALKARLFEPTTPKLMSLGTESRRFEIRNLANLSPLVEPRELLGPMLPGAALTDLHAIYVAETDSKPLYLPALMLIERLWLWSSDALRAILTPNSLDLRRGVPRALDHSIEVTVDPRLASRAPSDAALRRIAWLTQSSQARSSWSSVLTNAYQNRIDILLPPVSMSGWAWGVEFSSGYLACELLSLRLNIELTEPLPLFRIGNVLHKCPRASSALAAGSATRLETNPRRSDTQTEDPRPSRYPT